MQAAEPGDEQLLEAFRGGDERAFEVLVRRARFMPQVSQAS